jgi:hypothetical protein
MRRAFRAGLLRREAVFSLNMLVETIREFNRASPFLSYEIRTNGGERLRMPHPDFVFVAPKGAWARCHNGCVRFKVARAFQRVGNARSFVTCFTRWKARATY